MIPFHEKRCVRVIRGATALVLLATVYVTRAAWAQEVNPEDGARTARLVADPSAFAMDAGTAMRYRVTAYDAEGNVVNPPLRVASSLGGVEVANGMVRALSPGEHIVVFSVVVDGAPDVEPATLTVPVSVGYPRITRVELEPLTERLYQGTTLQHRLRGAYHADGSKRPDPVVYWQSSDERIATVDAYGNVTAVGRGRVTITADVDGVFASVQHEVAAFPATALAIQGGATEARTGDVLTFTARATASGDRVVEDLPVTWRYEFTPADGGAAASDPAILADGRFVASVPGTYTIVASAGPLSARHTVQVVPRGVARGIEQVGQGPTGEHRSTDLWVYRGDDGRDYALTGTSGGAGYAFVWDVTDPATPVVRDSIAPDVRYIAEVKVSPDARYAALARETASTRRNGIAILDLADPAHPVIAANYDEGLAGGLHPIAADERHLYVVSGADEIVILDVSDLANPTRVGQYRFAEPGTRLHDIRVDDGLLYASRWRHGVAVLDVGNGVAGGSPQQPALVTSIPYPESGAHVSFPYIQAATGKRYLFVGDPILEHADLAFADGSTPASGPAGSVRVIDWSDPSDPREVARYDVAGYGAHNLWVEDDTLYIACQDGALRVVDISGELMGNLHEQGRDIAVLEASHSAEFIAGAPRIWGPRPLHGTIFLSDWNSGIYAVRLRP